MKKLIFVVFITAIFLAGCIENTIESNVTTSTTTTTSTTEPPGWLGTWANRIRIDIDNTKIGEDLTDFTFVIYLSSSSGLTGADVSGIFKSLGSNSSKIACTTADGTTQLYVEVEDWDQIGLNQLKS